MVAIATFSADNRVFSGSVPKFFTRMGVLVRSGLMQLTAMPNGSHSCAIACTKFTMAAFRRGIDAVESSAASIGTGGEEN